MTVSNNMDYMGVSDDLLDRLMAYEDGSLDMEDTLELFQNLVDTGLINHLQGHYGRSAMALIEAGMIRANGEAVH